LVGFIGDLQKVGERIQQAQDSYNDARRKFSEGSGNVIRQAEMLKQLGVKPSKALPAQWVEPALEEPYPTLTSNLTNNVP
jgi:DNA recombination protein RmuC